MARDISVLHVDDDAALLDLTAKMLETEVSEFDVTPVTDPREALDHVDAVDCVVSDYQMPEMTGLDLLERVRERDPDVPFILFTGKGSEEIASDAISAGVTDYLQKERGVDQFTVLANRIERTVEQRRTQAQLDRRVQAIESASDGIALLDEDERYVYVNEAHADVYGYDRETFEGRSWEFLYEPAETRRLRETVLPALRADGEWHGELTGRRADGTTFPQDLSLTRTAEGLVCVVRDVTDRHERERELHESRRRFRTLIQNLPGMVYRARNEPDWPMSFVSDGCRDLTGYDPHDIVEGEVVWGEDVIHPDDQAGLWDPVQTAIEEREPFQVNYRIVTADDEVRWVWEQGEGVYEDGEVVALEGFITDVTDRHRKTERLSSFAHVLSHDIRSPLSVAIAELEHAKAAGDAETGIDSAIAQLSRIDDITDELLAVAEGTREDESVAVDLATVAEKAWTSFETPDCDLQIEDDVSFDTDREAVLRVLENLFTNAVDHGGGDTTVRVGATADGFYVADDGPGIPAADQETVFEAGYTTKEDGTGYGLLSVRQVAHVHGWTVTATESAAGGARFEVTGLTVSRRT